MASRRDLDSFDVPASRTVGTFTVATCIIALALFAGVALHPKNTLALVDPSSDGCARRLPSGISTALISWHGSSAIS